jgi:hypothetical protein
MASVPIPDQALPAVLIPRHGGPTRSLPGSLRCPVRSRFGPGERGTPAFSCPDPVGTEKRHDLFQSSSL